MHIKTLTVEIRRRPSGALEAYVVQSDAEGAVRGCNLLRGCVYKLDTARKQVMESLNGKVKNIRWRDQV